MSYDLWCPADDGTQHLPCVYEVNPAEGIWDHIPTEQEQITVKNRRLPAAWIQRHGLYGIGQHAFVPTRCHFDKVDPEHERDVWPDHWHPPFGGKHVQIGGWGGTVEEYPRIKRLYRCSVHNVPPTAVTLRYAPRRERDWKQLRNAKFREFLYERTDEEKAEVLGHPPDPNGHERYYITNIRGWVLNRPAPMTTHDLW